MQTSRKRIATLIVAGLNVAAAMQPLSAPAAGAVGTELPGHEAAISVTRIDIPDAVAAGIAIGPLSTDARGRLDDVVLAITVSHPYAGELTFALSYDEDRDGRPDYTVPAEIHLARRSVHGPEAYACPIEMEGTYVFKDEGWRSAGEDFSFCAFDGLGAGGYWYLTVVDNGPGQVGTIDDWAVYTSSQKDAIDSGVD